MAYVIDKRISYRALFAGVFLAAWSVDILSVVTTWPGDYARLLTGVGGAGPLDELLLVPAAAVFCTHAPSSI
jgi:hypothetical protein